MRDRDSTQTLSEMFAVDEVDQLPEQIGARGPRDSLCLQAYLAAKNSPTGIVRIKPTGADSERMVRFYRSMNQWKKRHAETGVQVRKDGDDVYVYLDKSTTASEAAKGTRASREAGAGPKSGD